MVRNDSLSFSAYSTVFDKVDDSVFIRDKIANKVRWINNDQNDLNLNINNENRLKEILFNEILLMYNQRIKNYKLEFPYLNKSDLNNVEIVKFALVQDKDKESSGYYSIFPRTFYCPKCGDFRVFKNEQEWQNFNPTKCRRPGCNGSYKQTILLKFCSQCGKLESIYVRCSNENHDTKYLKLIQEERDKPSTWYVKCTECEKEGIKSKINLLPNSCNHYDIFSNTKICNEPAKKFKVMNVSRSAVSKPVTITTVDVPQDNNISEEWDLFNLGFYLNLFDTFQGEEVKPKDMSEYLKIYQRYLEEGEVHKLFEPIIPYIKSVYDVIKDLRSQYQDKHLNEFNDYLILKNSAKNDEFNVTLPDTVLNDLNDSFGVKEVTYISDIHLITSAIGSIKGLDKFYETGFVPHFEPYTRFVRGGERNIIKIYSYPYETEGIMFDLDKIKVVNWLIDNKFLSNNKVQNEDDANTILFELNEDSKAYIELKKLIHTFAHVLIRRSSLYTGLNSDSCGELLFPKTAAFLIYSTSNINIGGFRFVYENSIKDWFRDVKLDVNDCVFDPTCLDETGACFSCLYLPEFVCSEFNHFLDRDVFLAQTNRYLKRFWK